jgi:hypothetical protein
VSEAHKNVLASVFVAFVIGFAGGLSLTDCADWRANCANACGNVELRIGRAGELYDEATGGRLSAVCECVTGDHP